MRRVLTFREILTRIVNKLGATKEKTKEYFCKHLNCKFIAHEDLVVITEDGNPNIVIPWLSLISCYESFICLSDFVIFHLSDSTRCGQDNIQDLKNLIQGIMSDLIEHGSGFYKSFKD